MSISLDLVAEFMTLGAEQFGFPVLMMTLRAFKIRPVMRRIMGVWVHVLGEFHQQFGISMTPRTAPGVCPGLWLYRLVAEFAGDVIFLVECTGFVVGVIEGVDVYIKFLLFLLQFRLSGLFFPLLDGDGKQKG